MALFNYKNVFISVKKFYESDVQKGTIDVYFNYPINDTNSYNIKRETDLQSTCDNLMSKIKVTLSSYIKITYFDGKFDITNNIKTKNNLLQSFSNKNFNNYLIQNGLA